MMPTESEQTDRSARMKIVPRNGVWLVVTAMVTMLALAANGTIDIPKSTIVATFKQENVPVDAPFRRFAGSIHYDPARPEVSDAALNVDVASFDIGDPAYNAEVRKPAWFDSARFPQASFRSTAIKAGTAGHFDATGTLSIKGRTQTLTVSITVQRSGHVDSFNGSFDISRKAFGIGDPSWNDVLDDRVRVRFHLLSTGA